MGKRLKLHPVFASISMVRAGLIVFGTSGLVLGSVMFPVTAVLLEVWRRRTAAEAAATKDVAGQAVEQTEGGDIAEVDATSR